MIQKIREFFKKVIVEAFEEYQSESRHKATIDEVDILRKIVGSTAVIDGGKGISVLNSTSDLSQGSKIIIISSVMVSREVSLEGRSTEVTVKDGDGEEYKLDSKALKSILR